MTAQLDSTEVVWRPEKRSPTPRRPRAKKLTEAQRQEMADRATNELFDNFPHMSAREVLTHRQKVVGIVTVVLLVLFAIPFPIAVGQLITSVLTLIYASAVYYRVRCFRLGLRGSHVHRVTDEEARAFADADLPIYTVLIPAYREPEVIGDLLRHVGALDYPSDKLDVVILLEEDDDVTPPALAVHKLAPYVRVLVVPAGAVTTKPRACNYGLELARGSLVTIFDAEDEPDSLQLRKAAIVLAERPDNVAGLQARLAFANADQNIMTKWFTAEYLAWFQYFLPGLSEIGSPIPLGGTSNHLRADALRAVGGWDPYNVTEDADLGLRLARSGFHIENLDSVTLEEANSDFVNWVKQRSRWLKGYLLTWLVHMRHPIQLKREVGWRGLAGINLFVGGTPLLSLINPVVWTTTLLWFLAKPRAIAELFSGPTYYLALITWVAGNFAIIYMGVVTLRRTGRPELLLSALLVPAYWVMMALAAVKGGIQLVRDPAYWEKTTHGLGQTASSTPGGLPTPAPVAQAETASTPAPADTIGPDAVVAPKPRAKPRPKPKPVVVPELVPVLTLVPSSELTPATVRKRKPAVAAAPAPIKAAPTRAAPAKRAAATPKAAAPPKPAAVPPVPAKVALPVKRVRPAATSATSTATRRPAVKTAAATKPAARKPATAIPALRLVTSTDGDSTAARPTRSPRKSAKPVSEAPPSRPRQSRPRAASRPVERDALDRLRERQ